MPSGLISGPLAHTRGSVLGALGYQGRTSAHTKLPEVRRFVSDLPLDVATDAGLLVRDHRLTREHRIDRTA